MNIQSLSVDVSSKCSNGCKFCVSRMHHDEVYHEINESYDAERYRRMVADRLQYARDMGCNTLIFTGTGEPLCDMSNMSVIRNINGSIRTPFINLEVQTSGIVSGGIGHLHLGSRTVIHSLRQMRISTVSLSVSALADDVNMSIISPAYLENIPTAVKSKFIKNSCTTLINQGFNVRLSINLTSWFDTYHADNMYKLFKHIEDLGVHQVTFRKLYADDGHSLQSRWVRDNAASYETINAIYDYIRANGKVLNTLPYGATRYSVHGMSTIIDTDCMSAESTGDLKYMILRPNAKLYSHWDTKGSIIF